MFKQYHEDDVLKEICTTDTCKAKNIFRCFVFVFANMKLTIIQTLSPLFEHILYTPPLETKRTMLSICTINTLFADHLKLRFHIIEFEKGKSMNFFGPSLAMR